jgi:hypothetical protein
MTQPNPARQTFPGMKQTMHSRCGVLTLTLAVALFGIACGKNSDSAAVSAAGQASSDTLVMPTVSTIDGVREMTHDATAFDRARKLELVGEPITVLGGADAEYDLQYATAQFLNDGRIATLARVGNQFYLFGRDGSGPRVLARNGGGPGELMRPSGPAVLAGDTLLIYDDGNLSISRFSPDGKLVRSVPRSAAGRGRSEKFMGALPGNRLVMSNRGLVQRGIPERVTRPTAFVSVVDSAGNTTHVADIPDLEVIEMDIEQRGRKVRETFFLAYGRFANVMVWDSSIVTSSGDGYRIDLRNAGGQVFSRLVVERPARAVTAEMNEARIQRAVSGMRRSGGEGGGDVLTIAEFEKYERATPVADSLPFFNAFFPTRSGTLWVLDYSPPTDSGWSATAFRSDGAIVGRLHVPNAGRPVAFEGDKVLVRTEDEDGVVTMSVRRIAPRTTQN